MPVSFISLRFERVDNLGAYRIPPETGILMEGDSAHDLDWLASDSGRIGRPLETGRIR